MLSMNLDNKLNFLLMANAINPNPSSTQITGFIVSLLKIWINWD